MKRKKVFILLPDGIGLRNFAYTDFNQHAKDQNIDVVFWNNSSFDIDSLGFNEIKIRNAKTNFLTDILKKARVHIDLNLNIKKFNDEIYESYRFKLVNDSLVNIIKTVFIRIVIFLFSSEKGVEMIRRAILRCEQKTAFFRDCLETLEKEKPDFVLCTNQRVTLALAPILAAEKLNIPTGTVIFSWDNLPKATLVLEPNYYFVWSKHMKEELMKYYSFIAESQIFVTGTTQFEMHNNAAWLMHRSLFFKENKLDPTKRYICFSGDDITTSPNDPIYLEDTAKAVLALNSNGYSLGIIFRRCPVDYSTRYDSVLKKYQDLIVPIEPKWQKMGDSWNSILPKKEDLALQINIIAHTEMVVNLGSTMVFDYITHKKPCAYIRYDVPNSVHEVRTVQKIYDFVHFRSMPNKDSVLWIDAPSEIASIIQMALDPPSEVIENAQKWFEKINIHPVNKASERILSTIKEIMK